MVQTLILRFDDLTKFEKVLQLAKQLKVSFETTDPTTLWAIGNHKVIQNRLIEKYVSSGEWAKMTDEERQDASLLEKMLFEEEQPDYKVYTVEESDKLLADLKNELYADSTY
jgi:hypothetical protein